ncbi:M42 family metallopeptidase [Lutispora thermophila]|uniref:Endoglucanase n=1 Tax=Lutispora thermophila DSM 19022 TaxID=1122184 RepID=A0A1M6GCG8_9FIRM|nr:M20/M25/M40 family metallo-hydrolase [Lutispora thermophila]SHJ07643.1 endoglucanase [Lutispora thermophila DSM 19022]
MLLKELTQTFGVSGYEKEVRDYIKDKVKNYADDIIVDAIGNLIVYKKGYGENKKKIMAAAHMDEIGIQVTKIESSGFIKFKTLGFLWPDTTYMSRVKFRNGVVGIVNSTIPMENVKGDFTKLCIDIGAKSKEEAMEFVKVGDVASYIGPYEELKGNNVTAKALDNRAGCYVLIKALMEMGTPYNDVYLVFTVQEELGCRGSKVTAERIQPDIGIAVDITPAHDYPCDLEGSNTLGDGTGIKISDPSVICDEYLVSEMVKCCVENNIKYQYDVIAKGGTDASSINLSNYGVRASGISIVTRYPHGPNSMVNMGDIAASAKLLSKYVDREFQF